MPKALRLAIWVNGIASILLALSLVAVAMAALSLPNPPNQTLFRLVTPFLTVAVVMFPILGFFMVVMEFLSRRGSNKLR